MSRPIQPNDLLAVTLLWALIVVGCLIGDVRPVHTALALGCQPDAPLRP